MNEIIQIEKLIQFTLGDSILEIIYIIASVLFILGLKMLSNPGTARKGNLWAAFGMGLAIVGTILFHKNSEGHGIGNIPWILGAILIGTVIGWGVAVKVKMTAMPQLVSLFNGMGGGAAALISLMEFPHLAAGLADGTYNMFSGQVLAILIGLMIGSVSFAGSMVAFGKLDERIGDIRSPLIKYINMFLLVVLIGFIVYIMSQGTVDPHSLMPVIIIMFVVALIYGISFVMPIGGADMPVVISLLNSFTGVAAAMGGFLYHNQAMLTGGILVGSAGTILTILMCKAMNRSLTNVIIGGFGGGSSKSTAAGAVGDQVAKEVTANDAAIQLYYSRSVMFVPGYGLAVAQAQKTVKELDDLLSENGVEVNYAVHSVAGRMPGHMNVLMAEADVPYEKLLGEEEANDRMKNVDVIIVVGANDVVNPSAYDDPGSPIFGMPVINAWEAKSVIILKRSMNTGYAGIQNPLFFKPNAKMLFGDAKKTIHSLITEVKSLG